MRQKEEQRIRGVGDRGAKEMREKGIRKEIMKEEK